MHATSPDGGRDAPSLLDISVKTREDDEGGAAAKTTMTTTTTTRQRVEEVVKTLDVAKLQEDWVNAICEKLEGKLASKAQEEDVSDSEAGDASSRDHGDEEGGGALGSDETPPDDSGSSRRSSEGVLVRPDTDAVARDREFSDTTPGPTSKQPSHPYRATVEDEPPQDADTPLAGQQPGKASTRPHYSPSSSTTTAAAASPALSYASHVSSSYSSHSVDTGSSGGGGGGGKTPSSSSTGASTAVPASPQARRPSVHFSKRPPPVVLNNGMPEAVAAQALEVVKSPVDMKWGELFSDMGEPTRRLGSVLLGLADHLISEFNPVDSLVIGPEKLDAFYRKFRLDSEIVDFYRMFDSSSERSLRSLEGLYASLGCEYHLAPSNAPVGGGGGGGARPSTPALTPRGFERWMTLFMRAYPEREARRLDAAVASLPLEADGFGDGGLRGRRERLPRQLSRHLLPARRHDRSFERLVGAVDAWERHVGYGDGQAAGSSSSSSRGTGAAVRPGVGVTYGSDETVKRYRPEAEGRGEVEVPRSASHRSRSRSDHSKKYDRNTGRDSQSSRYHNRSNPDRPPSRASRDLSPPPPSSGRHHHRRRSPPPSSRYRNSVPSISTSNSSSASTANTTAGGHHASTPSVSEAASPGQARRGGGGGGGGRGDEYRLFQGREGRSTMEEALRGVAEGRDAAGKRKGGAVPGTAAGQQNPGPTYEEFLRSGGRTGRGSSEAGGAYRGK